MKKHLKVFKKALKDFEAQLDRFSVPGDEFVDAVGSMIESGHGRVIVSGVGKSGMIGRKLSVSIASLGIPSQFIHPTEGLHGDLGSLEASDVLLAISNSGKTSELNSFVGHAIDGFHLDEVFYLSSAEELDLGPLVKQIWHPKAIEFDPRSTIPTASTSITMLAGDLLIGALVNAGIKMIGEDSFYRSFATAHPGGVIGARMNA